MRSGGRKTASQVSKLENEHGTKNANGKPGGPTFWTPRRSNEFHRKLQEAISRSGLALQIGERAGISLKSVLCRSALEPVTCAFEGRCTLCNMQPKNGICVFCNCVYEVSCKSCGESYVGETGSPLGICVKQHMSSVRLGYEESSALAAQVMNKHGGETQEFEFHV